MCEYGDTKSKMVGIICVGTGIVCVYYMCGYCLCEYGGTKLTSQHTNTACVCSMWAYHLCVHVI